MEKRLTGSRNLALVGLPASGKSSVGFALAKRLELPFVDLDEAIVSELRRSIADIFKVDGEATFRQLETGFLDRATSGGAVVVSTGGGCVLAAENRDILRERCLVIWLDISPGEAAARARAGSGHTCARDSGAGGQGSRETSGRDLRLSAVRPLLADGDVLQRMQALDAVRRPLYRECADIVIQVEGKTLAVIVEELYAAMD